MQKITSLHALLSVSVLAFAAACSSASESDQPSSSSDGTSPSSGASSSGASSSGSTSSSSSSSSSGGASSGTPAPDAGTATKVVGGTCVYTNSFTKGQDCREYDGSGWNAATAAKDCAEHSNQAGPGTYDANGDCSFASTLGDCVFDSGKPTQNRVVVEGSDASKCSSTKQGCELFAGGKFVPSTVCK